MKHIILISILCISYTCFSQVTGLTLNKLYIQDEPDVIFNKGQYKVRPFFVQKQEIPQITPLVFKSPYRYTDDLGFFCKVELKWDKKLTRPFRFRLGSYDYVNRLEGK